MFSNRSRGNFSAKFLHIRVFTIYTKENVMDLHLIEMYGQSSTNLAYKFLEIQQVIQPSTTIEIGSYDGWFSKKIKSTIPNCESIAFEANPHVFHRFYDYYKGVDFRNLAISNKIGEIDFFHGGFLDGSNSTKRHEDWTGRESFKVKSSTLDSQAEGKNNISLWVDVEGASEEVLTGGKNTLKNVNSIYIEVESKVCWENQWIKNDVISYLEQFNLVPIAEEGQYYYNSNLIFLRKSLISEEIINIFHNFFTKTYFYL